MKKNKFKVIFKYLAIFMLIIAFTKTSFSRDLTLDEAEKIAIENNLSIKLVNNSVKEANISYKEAIGSAFPTVNAFGQFTDNFELPIMTIEMPSLTDPGQTNKISMKMGTKYNAILGISASQPIFTGGAIFAGYNITKKGVYLSKLQQESQRDNIILNIRILYYQIQLMKSLINATSQSYASAESNYELVKKQKAVGKVSKFEVLQAQVQYRSLKPKLISLKNQKDILLTNFLTLLNDEDLDSIVISEELQKESNPYKNKSLEYIKSIALKKRTELKLLNGQKYIQRNKRLISYSSGLPKVSIQSQIQYQSQAETIDELDYIKSMNASVNLSIPIFSGARNFRKIQKSNIEIKKTNIQYEQMRNHILNEVESTYLKVKETEANIEANAGLIGQAKEALRLAKLMYENGRIIQLEVQSSESSYLQAQSAYYQSIFEYNVAINSLKQSLNEL
jgi:outer membrane protein TolC